MSVSSILKKMRKEDEAKLGKGGKVGEKKEEKKPEMVGNAGKTLIGPLSFQLFKHFAKILNR